MSSDIFEQVAEIFRELYSQGYEHGHNDTVESMYCDSKEQFNDYWNDGEYEELRQQIDQLYRKQWISVEDRLPDEFGSYQVYVPALKTSGCKGITWAGWGDESGSRKEPCWQYQRLKVTHWMLLPEPPIKQELQSDE